MVIYLRHPNHGTKVAVSEMEAAYDESNGWRRFSLDTVAVHADVTIEDSEGADCGDSSLDNLRSAFELKFGRRPDLRWKSDRLTREIG
jgi:hypothetical protein